jgi:hypothetical protein
MTGRGLRRKMVEGQSLPFSLALAKCGTPNLAEPIALACAPAALTYINDDMERFAACLLTFLRNDVWKFYWSKQVRVSLRRAYCN